MPMNMGLLYSQLDSCVNDAGDSMQQYDYCYYNLYKHSYVLRCIFDDVYSSFMLLLRLLFTVIHCFIFT